MSSFRFKIDEKSLYFGIYNDYIKGETATVSTPINQPKNPKKWRHDILKFKESGLEVKNMPDVLIEKCLKNTSLFKNVILNTLELQRTVNKQTGNYMYCSGQSHTVQLHNEMLANRHFENVLNNHLPNDIIRTAQVNHLTFDYMKDHINKNKTKFEQFVEFGRAQTKQNRIKLKIEQDKNRTTLHDNVASIAAKSLRVGKQAGQDKWGSRRDAN